MVRRSKVITTAYRLVFGRPRQEDLLAYLVDRVAPERLEELKDLLQIDLTPRERG